MVFGVWFYTYLFVISKTIKYSIPDNINIYSQKFMANIPNLASYLDFANHHLDATEDDIKLLVEKVKEHHFNSAFVNQTYVPLARNLMGNDGKIGSIVAFPMGEELIDSKLKEAEDTARAGADELDTSLNIAYIKTGKWDQLLDEMKRIVSLVKSINPNKIVKFIPETGYLTPDEIKKTAEVMTHSGADFFKTCSGMGPRGATLEDVKLVREAIGNQLKIKVAGGISTYDQAVAFIEAGADRIGTSKAVEIVTQQNNSAHSTPPLSE